MSGTPRNTPAKAPVPGTIAIGPSTAIDVSWLPEQERAELLKDHAKGLISLHQRAQEMHVDVNALQASLDTLSETTRSAAMDGNAITATHTQTTSIGRTEVIMGNTDSARSGKLSRSATGQADWTPLYVIAIIIAIVLVATAFAN